MEVITYKCPNCGGDLTFDPVSGKYKCEYCLSSFTQEEMEKLLKCCYYDTEVDF